MAGVWDITSSREYPLNRTNASFAQIIFPVWSVKKMAFATDAIARASKDCAAGCERMSPAELVMAGIAGGSMPGVAAEAARTTESSFVTLFS